VNQNLNNAVTFYRDKLLIFDSKAVKKEIFVEPREGHEYNDEYLPNSENGSYEIECNDLDYIEKPVKKKRKKRLKKEINGTKNEQSEVDNKAKKELKYKAWNIRMKAKLGEVEEVLLIPYIKYNSETKKFNCSLCTKQCNQRPNLLRHLNLIHGNGIKLKENISASNPTQVYDCETKMCRKTYGPKYRNFWCEQCTVLSKIVKKKIRSQKDGAVKKPGKFELCPDCGKNFQNLKTHYEQQHGNEKVNCPHCPKVFYSKQYLYNHVRSVHTKVPCIHCGKLIGESRMKYHLMQHAPNDEKKFKCEVCGKGFTEIQRLNDHNNIHTGEKPYKCKFCSACFASRGTLGGHERSHLGHKRNFSNK